MRVPLYPLAATLILAAVPCFGLAPTHHTTPTATHSSVRHAAIRSHKTEHAAIRQGMDTARATQIQTALVKAGYLSGEPSGTWDSQSIAAMQKLQGDNGWQTKLTPDSRALIKLGLGPQADSQPAPVNPSQNP